QELAENASAYWTKGISRRSAAGMFVTPVVLVAVCLALFGYLRTQDLDEMELRAVSPDFILQSTVEHLRLIALSTVLVIVIAIPIGVALTRSRLRQLAT